MLRLLLRPIKHVFLLIYCTIYDLFRYLIYSSIARPDKGLVYKVIKTYHSLEKNLSFKNRDRKSGQGAALKLTTIYKNNFPVEKDNLQYKVGLKVLTEYTAHSDLGSSLRSEIDNTLLQYADFIDDSVQGGALKLDTLSMMEKGKLENPEDFFLTRYSIRNFSNKRVDIDLIKQALNLASKTPSVCNRQEWVIYQIEDRSKITKALELQNGNRGFGESINNLLIVAIDLRAFEDAYERFQSWIDGGLYAMSLMYAFHSLGISSCILNLCNSPIKDIKLRKIVGSKNEHTFIVMIAIGYPELDTKICVSARTSFESYHHRV